VVAVRFGDRPGWWDFESTFEYSKLGQNATDLKSALSGEFAKKLQSAKKPMIIVGSAVTEHPDAKSFFEQIGAFVEKNKGNFQSQEWNGYNILQRTASRTGAYDVGFTVPSPEVANNEADIPKDAFVVYQGHHGDRGAQLADVVLPGAAYTEKSVTFVNTEGRVQMTRAAVGLPGASREDWKIIRAASEYLGAELPYDDVEALRDRMEEISPALRRYDLVEPVSLPGLSKVQLVDQNKGSQVSGTPLKKPIENFFFTDAISRKYVTTPCGFIGPNANYHTVHPRWPDVQQRRQRRTPRQTSWHRVPRTHKFTMAPNRQGRQTSRVECFV
jgi:NADH dehydrogenase (ubiquinone) Fe-S protein 1